MTFTPRQEVTEEGLPFMIPFHRIDDIDTLKCFKYILAKDLLNEIHMLVGVHLKIVALGSFTCQYVAYHVFTFGYTARPLQLINTTSSDCCIVPEISLINK